MAAPTASTTYMVHLTWPSAPEDDIVPLTVVALAGATCDQVHAAITQQFWSKNATLDQRVHTFPEGAWDITVEKDEEDYIVTLTPKEAALPFKTVKLMLNRAVHTFLLPFGRDLGDFLPQLVTHSDVQFARCCRAQVMSVEVGGSGEFVLHLRVHHIHLDRTEIEEDVKVDVRHLFDSSLSDEDCDYFRPMLLSSLEKNPLWIWYDPKRSLQLHRDASALMDRVWHCVGGGVTSTSLLPEPVVFGGAAAPLMMDVDVELESATIKPLVRMNRAAGETFALITARASHKALRAAVLERDGKCILTGGVTRNAIEAAHIVAVKDYEQLVGTPLETGLGIMNPLNGIMLRRDLHNLWDKGDFSFRIGTNCGKVKLVVPTALADYPDLVHGQVVPSFPADSIPFLKRKLAIATASSASASHA